MDQESLRPSRHRTPGQVRRRWRDGGGADGGLARHQYTGVIRKGKVGTITAPLPTCMGRWAEVTISSEKTQEY